MACGSSAIPAGTANGRHERPWRPLGCASSRRAGARCHPVRSLRTHAAMPDASISTISGSVPGAAWTRPRRPVRAVTRSRRRTSCDIATAASRTAGCVGMRSGVSVTRPTHRSLAVRSNGRESSGGELRPMEALAPYPRWGSVARRGSDRRSSSGFVTTVIELDAHGNGVANDVENRRGALDGGRAAFADGDFYASPAPVVLLRKPDRLRTSAKCSSSARGSGRVSSAGSQPRSGSVRASPASKARCEAQRP